MPMYIDPELLERHYSVMLFRGYVLLLQKKLGETEAQAFFSSTGVPLEYFLKETNYVSEKWADIFYQRLQDHKDFQQSDIEEVAKISLSREALGALQLWAVRFVSVSALMRNSLQFAARVNQVDKYHVTKLTSDELVFHFTSRRKTIHFPMILAGWKSLLEIAPTIRGGPRGSCLINRISDTEASMSVTWKNSQRELSNNLVTTGFFAALIVLLTTLSKQSGFGLYVGILSVAMMVLAYLHAWRSHRTLGLDRSGQSNLVEEVIKQADLKHDELVQEKKKVDRRFREAHLLNTIIQRIGLAQSSQTLIQMTIAELMTSLGYDRVMYLQCRGDRLSVMAHQGFEGTVRDLIETYSIDLSATTTEQFHLGNVFKRKDSILVPVTKDYFKTLSSTGASLLKSAGSNSFLIATVASNENAHGVLMVDYVRTEKTLNEDDLQLVKSLCNQLAIYLDQVLATEREQLLKNEFQKFVPEKIVEIVQREGKLLAPSRLQTVSILFSDVRAFTKKSSRVPPEVVIDSINIYLSYCNRIVRKTGGLVDKYMGDGILAVYNKFNETPDHALAAVGAAIEMQLAMPKIREELRTKLPVDSEWADWEIGVAVHTGVVISGLIGTEFKMDHTILGDPVNLCSRLCELTKTHSNSILISPEVFEKVSDHFETEPLEAISIRGHGKVVIPYKVDWEAFRNKAA